MSLCQNILTYFCSGNYNTRVPNKDLFNVYLLQEINLFYKVYLRKTLHDTLKKK